MFNIGKATETMTRFGGRAMLFVQKHSDKILLGAGLVSGGLTVFTACQATLKVDDILAEHQEKMDKIDSVVNNPNLRDQYSDADMQKDKAIVYVQTAVEMGKNYLPAITFGALSVGCILGAHHILSSRNVALMAAYKACEESFNNYRKNVVDELGEDADNRFRLGLKEETIKATVLDDKGNETEEEKKEIVPGLVASPYARFFDEANPNWEKSPERNMFFLKSVQNMLNDTLKKRGHLFLNEVYDALGFKRTAAGAVVGWIYGGPSSKDECVDFGIFDPDDETKRDFVNGYERSILLDFNVDGVIYDLI